MFIELIDALRCPSPHDETWLVASLDSVDGRVVMEGRLGCPVCGAAYPVRGGAAEFDSPAVRDGPELDPWTVAALLALDTPGKVVVTFGAAPAIAHALSETFGARVVFVGGAEISPRQDLAIVRSSGLAALRSGVADGVVTSGSPAVDDVMHAARVLRNGGRLVTPAGTTLPPELEPLAADDRLRVSRKLEPAQPVPLRRA